MRLAQCLPRLQRPAFVLSAVTFWLVARRGNAFAPTSRRLGQPLRISPSHPPPSPWQRVNHPQSRELSAGDDVAHPESPSVIVVDVVVIGAGVGGLSCGALTSKYGLDTLIVEAHDRPGGVAHSFTRPSSSNKKSEPRPFVWDSGPSLLTGLSRSGSTNPLRQVLEALDVVDEIEWVTYDGWMVHDIRRSQQPQQASSFKLTTGDGGQWEAALERKAGKESREAFATFRHHLLQPRGLAEASAYIPPFALRGDMNAVRSLSRYFLKLLRIGTRGTLLTGPFTKVLDLYDCHDPFLRKWFDYLAFALSGCDAAHTQAAAVAYMMMDLHQPGAVLDYPKGGMESLIQALVTGLEKHGGRLQVNARVERLLLAEEEGSSGQAECRGVVLQDGTVIQARRGVVCNAPLWNMARILEDSLVDVADETGAAAATTAARGGAVQAAVQEIRQQADAMYMTGSFMHLHLGIPKDGLPDDLECHHSVLDFSKDIAAEQNMVIISIPTVFDPSLAPEGYHVVHAYTAACDSFDDWEPFLEGGMEIGKVGHSPNSGASAKYGKVPGYQDLKDEKAEVLWKAIECVIPDVRERAKRKGSVSLVGTPLTHRRYNQRFRGTYGPSNAPGKDVWELPGATTKIKGLLACGDTTFPGIGIPGVAASGTIAANTLVSVRQQSALMNELRKKGALQ